MRRRRLAALVLFVAATAALAGGGVVTNPFNLRPNHVAPSQVRSDAWRPLSSWRAPVGGLRPAEIRPQPPTGRIGRLVGQVSCITAIGRDGARFTLPLTAPLALSAPLPVPNWPVADLEITLDGPVRVEVSSGGQLRTWLGPEVLTVAVDDPDEAADLGEIRLILAAEALDPAALEGSLQAVAH